MSSLAEILKSLQSKYKKNEESDKLLSCLKEINKNPLLMFDNKANLTKNDSLFILLNILFEIDDEIDNYTSMNIKSAILDILIESVKYPEIAWYIIDNCEIIYRLFNDLNSEKSNNINSKILKCLVLYLDFERSDAKIFGYCDEICCELNPRKRIPLKTVISACCSIVKLCLMEVDNEQVDSIDESLIALNHVYRHFQIQLSPETCGDTKMYDKFRHFLLSVFESKKYSLICVVNSLSCLLCCRDSSTNKCFNETNIKYILAVIYDILVKFEPRDDSSSFHIKEAISLLSEMFQHSHLVDIINKLWTIEHFKTICKRFIADCTSSDYYEMFLDFFLANKDKIPEWNNCLYRFLHTNSKMFAFINKLIYQDSDRCSIMCWRLLKMYFKPSEILDVFIHEYLSTVINSIKSNLDRCLFTNKYIEFPNILIGRRHLNCVKLSLECCDFLLLLLDCDKLSDKFVNIYISSKIISSTLSLSIDLLKDENNSFITLKPYTSESLSPFLCHSNSWFFLGAQLVVSLMFINVSMSQLYPQLICTRDFEFLLSSSSFARLLAVCMTLNVEDNEIIERSLAVVAFCSRLSDYDVATLSKFIKVNNQYLSFGRRSLITNNNNNNDCSDITMINKGFSSMFIKDGYKHNQDNIESVNKIVDSWLLNNEQVFSVSDSILILKEYITNLKEHENILESSLSRKDEYIRQCNDSVDQYRSMIRNNGSIINNFISNTSNLNQSIVEKVTLIDEMKTVTEDLKGKLSVVNEEVTVKNVKVRELEGKLEESGDRLRRVCKDLEGSEELNNELRALLTKSEGENKSKDAEIKRLKDITETIESLFHRR